MTGTDMSSVSRIKRFFKGILVLKSPKPRFTWDSRVFLPNRKKETCSPNSISNVSSNSDLKFQAENLNN